MREYKCPHGALSVKVVGDIAQLSPLGVFRGELPWLIATLTEINGGQPEPEPAKKQVGGDHYAKHVIQVWDGLQCWLRGMDPFQAYLAGNIIKYVARHHDKNGVEDIRKAAHYCERLIQHLEGRDK